MAELQMKLGDERLDPEFQEVLRRFDDGEDVDDYYTGVPRMRHPDGSYTLVASRDDRPRHLQITLPCWLISLLDDEASRRGVSRKAVINDWLVDRADQEQARRAARA